MNPELSQNPGSFLNVMEEVCSAANNFFWSNNLIYGLCFSRVSHSRCLPSLSFNIVSVIIKVTILTSLPGPGAPRGVTSRFSQLPEKAPAIPQEPRAQESPQGSNTEHSSAQLKPFPGVGAISCYLGHLLIWEISIQTIGATEPEETQQVKGP